MRILVADDNAFFCTMLEATLKAWGYEPVIARNGEEALTLLQGCSAPRLALVDWMMPVVSGLELCRRVRALPQARSIYLILVTVKGGKENIVAGLKAGADDYLCKPFDLEELRARLQVGLRVVGLAERIQQLEAAQAGGQEVEPVSSPF